MSYNIIIDESGTTKSVSVDRLRIKNKDGGTIDYAPPTRYPYAKLIVYRNGTYSAADYGLTGFTGVEVKVGSRRDGRSCDTEYTDPEGVTASQAIEVGGIARNFDAGAIGVRMGTDAASASIAQWQPCAGTLTTGTTTISHQGTYTPQTGAAWSSVTVSVSGSEIMSTPGNQWTIPEGKTEPAPPECYIDDSNRGDMVKIRGGLHDHFWKWVTDTYCYRIDLDIEYVAILDNNSLYYYYDPTTVVEWPYPASDRIHSGVSSPYENKVISCVDTPVIPQTRRGKNLKFQRNSVPLASKLSGRVRLNAYIALPEYKNVREGYPYRYYNFSPTAMPSIDRSFEFDRQAAYSGSGVINSYADGDDFYFGLFFALRGNNAHVDPFVRFDRLSKITYLKQNINDPSDVTYITKAISATMDDSGYRQWFHAPITDVMYLGLKRDAPDWAKTITDDDL